MVDSYCDSGVCIIGDSWAIEIKNLSFRYGSTYAFNNIDLKIPHCAVTAIIGPSGSGKSTLLGCINRMNDFIRGGVVDGEIRVSDQDISLGSFDVLKLRKKIGMIFQNPNPFPMSIEKNITIPLKYHGIKNKDTREDQMQEALKDVGLWAEVKNRLQMSAMSLSGGQQQRLCIARAIALKPDILLMDEPCSALDPQSIVLIESLIAQLRARFTVVIVTHNLAQAKRVSDKTVLLWNRGAGGYIVDQGDTDRVFLNPANTISQNYISGSIC